MPLLAGHRGAGGSARKRQPPRPRLFPGKHLGINALLVGHRNNQQADPHRLKLVAERTDRGKRISPFIFGRSFCLLGRVPDARPIEEPSLFSQPPCRRNLPESTEGTGPTAEPG